MLNLKIWVFYHVTPFQNLKPFPPFLSFLFLFLFLSCFRCCLGRTKISFSSSFWFFLSCTPYLWMHVLNILNVLPNFVKIHTNSKCFVVTCVGAFCSLVFMIEGFFLWWIKVAWCSGGIHDGSFPMMFLSF
jgi:hypothetical protein